VQKKLILLPARLMFNSICRFATFVREQIGRKQQLMNFWKAWLKDLFADASELCDMDFDNVIQRRYSVRSFTSQKVDKNMILKILEAARMAPSAVNFQPWHFVVVSEQESLTKLHQVYHREWFMEAPLNIVVCADHQQSWKRKSDGKDFADVDAAIVIDHLVLKATEMGLGTCWICNFDVLLTREVLELPDYIEPIAIIPIGFTKSISPEKKRRDLSEMIHWEKF